MKINEKFIEIEIPIGYEIDKEKSTFERIVYKVIGDKFDKIYTYHNTTKEEFDELYKNLPPHVKAYQKEVMLVEYYNKGEKPDWNNRNQQKWIPWFYMDEFRLYSSGCYYGSSHAPSRLWFLNKADLEEALEEHFEIFKESRTI